MYFCVLVLVCVYESRVNIDLLWKSEEDLSVVGGAPRKDYLLFWVFHKLISDGITLGAMKRKQNTQIPDEVQRYSRFWRWPWWPSIVNYTFLGFLSLPSTYIYSVIYSVPILNLKALHATLHSILHCTLHYLLLLFTKQVTKLYEVKISKW